MIKTLTSYTFEIDEAEEALEELREQLDLENNLLRHSLGILTCYAEFLETGVVEAISDAMPFEIIGCTTMGSASCGELGHLMLSLTVLTSDEVQFSTGLTTSLLQEREAPIRDAYGAAASRLPGPPSLIFAFAPMIRTAGGEGMIKVMDSVSAGTPIFGTVAIDHNTDYHDSQTIHNGKAYREAMAFALVYGDIQPSFFIASISDEKIQRHKAIITKSSGSVLMEINGMSALEYMGTLGLRKGDGIDSAVTVPIILDYNDGTRPVVRSIYMVTPEGHAICGGDMPANSTLAIGSIDAEEVLSTTPVALGEALRTGKTTGLLMTTCLSRTLVLGADSTAEMEAVRSQVGDLLPYHLFYSGGEICPVPDENGKPVNRFHNNSFCACIF